MVILINILVNVFKFFGETPEPKSYLKRVAFLTKFVTLIRVQQNGQ